MNFIKYVSNCKEDLSYLKERFSAEGEYSVDRNLSGCLISNISSQLNTEAQVKTLLDLIINND